MTVGHGQGGQMPGRGQPGYGAYQRPVYGEPQLRAADADREWTVNYLRMAYTEGRLSHELYDDRMGRALAAQTYGELDAVIADLPRPAPPPPRGTNAYAIASLACGLGQAVLGPLPTIPAIVLGHMGRRQIKETGETGDGLALAGLILGWCGAILTVVAIIGILFVAAAFVHASPSPPIQGPG
jgi:uncharacterized protein DUF4190/uncharacterized protein DUF1707